MKLSWINKKATLEDLIHEFRMLQDKMDKMTKELELIRVALNLRE